MPVPKQEPRYAFVTPYYKEARDCLERCVASVRRQTVRADHILVADGFPRAGSITRASATCAWTARTGTTATRRAASAA